MPPEAGRYQAKLTDRARDDLEGIFEYIGLHSPQNAAGMIEQLLHEIDGLEQLPARFRVAGRSRIYGTDVHACTVRPFIIYYWVDELHNVVNILTVRHGARRQPRKFD